MEKRPTSNPRYANGALRRKYRARLKAMGGECGICHGRLGPIHYDEPSDAAHPLSFVIDEIKPVSKWRQFGYASPRAAAEDWGNLQPAHYFCNAQKGNKTGVFGGRFGAKSHKSAQNQRWKLVVGGGPRPPRRRPRPVQRRFTHREFLNEDEECDGPERPALQLKELAKVLAGSIDSCNDPKALPPLAKQYRGDHPGN